MEIVSSVIGRLSASFKCFYNVKTDSVYDRFSLIEPVISAKRGWRAHKNITETVPEMCSHFSNSYKTSPAI